MKEERMIITVNYMLADAKRRQALLLAELQDLEGHLRRYEGLLKGLKEARQTERALDDYQAQLNARRYWLTGGQE